MPPLPKHRSLAGWRRCSLPPASPQSEERWAWEPKWDGWRALIRATDGRITVLTRSGADVITSFPEQEALAAVIG